MNLKNLKKFIKEEIKKLNKNLTEKEDHPGCDCPGSPQHGILPFYKSWAQCTAGSGGVTSCAACCQGGVTHSPTPEDARTTPMSGPNVPMGSKMHQKRNQGNINMDNMPRRM